MALRPPICGRCESECNPRIQQYKARHYGTGDSYDVQSCLTGWKTTDYLWRRDRGGRQWASDTAEQLSPGRLSLPGSLAHVLDLRRAQTLAPHPRHTIPPPLRRQWDHSHDSFRAAGREALFGPPSQQSGCSHRNRLFTHTHTPTSGLHHRPAVAIIAEGTPIRST
eukprot:COSAG02_NODE_2294_length_9198_cov_3.122321_2_plen_166_part_00